MTAALLMPTQKESMRFFREGDSIRPSRRSNRRAQGNFRAHITELTAVMRVRTGGLTYDDFDLTSFQFFRNKKRSASMSWPRNISGNS